MGNNHVEWSDERLSSEMGRLSSHLKEAELVGERKEQVKRAMQIIAFEQCARYEQRKQDD